MRLINKGTDKYLHFINNNLHSMNSVWFNQVHPTSPSFTNFSSDSQITLRLLTGILKSEFEIGIFAGNLKSRGVNVVQFPLNIGFIHPTVVSWQQTQSYIRSTSTLPLVPCYIFLRQAFHTIKITIALHLQAVHITLISIDKDIRSHIRQST
jgi:hypothetical protein